MSEARNASTLILVRDSTTGMEVFLMRRHVRSEFVGGAHVFPGGALDDADRSCDAFAAGLTDAEASALLHVPHGGLAWWIAAARECFEEAGILMACAADRRMLDFSDARVTARYAELRRQLQRGELRFADLLASEGLRIAADRIHYWSHWITPAGLPRRFDTRFFLAVAPPAQTAGHDGHELTDSAWIAPDAALRKGETGEWFLPFPTTRNLAQLAACQSAAEAEAAARAPRDIAALQPLMIEDENGTRFVLPGEALSARPHHS